MIRLGAMGDILHALPAVHSLKQSFPDKRIAWLVASRWVPLLEGNPVIDELIPFQRRGPASVAITWRRLRHMRPGLAIDFQGLLQSALMGRMAKPKRFLGFDRSVARESVAAAFYTKPVPVSGPHRIERNLQLARAAGAKNLTDEIWIPQGQAEAHLPDKPFVLASPFAGWGSKQWPLAHYEELGKRLERHDWTLVLNVSKERAGELRGIKNAHVHVSQLPGLIDATRRAGAVVGVDSGPLHLAAVLKKPGVALFGQTDPAQTGPYQSAIRVIRQVDVESTYKRGDKIHPSMAAISPDDVSAALLASLADCKIQLAPAVRL